jgi:tetratricopeptide (TPR) repeat protein
LSCLARLDRHEEAVAEYMWIIPELDPAKRHADAEPSDRPAPPYIDARVELIEPLICLGRFKQAEAAAQIALELPNLDQPRLQALRRQREICQRLAPLEANLTAIIAENDQPPDLPTRRALAEWCYQYGGLPAAAVRLFETVFLNQPSLAEDPQFQDRFHAACAAALASSRHGSGVAKLSDPERSILRKKALEWLKADRNARVKRTTQAKAGAPANHADAMRGWLESSDLACVRDLSALEQLPESERKEWRAFWADLTALIPVNRFSFVDQARAQASLKQWAKATENYARFVNDAPLSDGDVWYEYAAVQLLSGDRQGYYQTCQRVLAGAGKAAEMRPYLAARLCTLGANSLEVTQLSATVSARELTQFATKFWSLTERGALDCRTSRFREAVPLFERSLRAESKPGAAVRNWLWLALAYHHLGEREQARRWLDKAGTWLDAVGGELPVGAELIFGLHLHNWLEANVLRREVEALISVSSAK